ncbi:hypothetical protein ACP275_10G113600 [Erythranthe tilingii]
MRQVCERLLFCLFFPEKRNLIMCKDERTTEEHAKIYWTKFLNTKRCSIIPSYGLKIKVGVPVMLIRNIDRAR